PKQPPWELPKQPWQLRWQAGASAVVLRAIKRTALYIEETSKKHNGANPTRIGPNLLAWSLARNDRHQAHPVRERPQASHAGYLRRVAALWKTLGVYWFRRPANHSQSR